jgi:hypothetical protein
MKKAAMVFILLGLGAGLFMTGFYYKSKPAYGIQNSALQSLFGVFQPRESHAQTTAPPCEYSLWDAYHMCLASCDGWYDVGKERESCKFGCKGMWQNVKSGNNPSNCHYRE